MEKCIEALKSGRPVVVIDPIRNLGVAGLPAAQASVSNVNFMIRECRGILYAGGEAARFDRLGLILQDSNVYAAVDASERTTTGISASDRARTIGALFDVTSSRSSFRSPGHVLPVAISTSDAIGGFYLAEALQYLSGLAGFSAGVLLCGILDRKGSMATTASLRRFAERFHLPIMDFISVARVRRMRDGWNRPLSPSGVIAESITRLGWNLVAHTRQAYQGHNRFPVAAFRICPRGYLLRQPCAITDSMDESLDALESQCVGAVAVLWRAEDLTPAPESADCRHSKVPLGWHRLLAAELAAATPRRLAGVGRRTNSDF